MLSMNNYSLTSSILQLSIYFVVIREHLFGKFFVKIFMNLGVLFSIELPAFQLFYKVYDETYMYLYIVEH